jgi:hypothetical protein
VSDTTRSGSVLIDSVQVEDRHRRDLGDLSGLCESIERLDLLHPIVVTRDLRLVAGHRRLEACRKLGRTEIRASIVDHLDAASALLVAERDENTCRKAMSASELYALGKALEDLERPKAEERRREAGRNHGRGMDSSGSAEPNLSPGRTYEVVAPAVDMSPAQWKRLKHIGQRAEEGDPVAAETLAAIDKGNQTIAGGYRAMRGDSTDLGNIGNIRTVPKKRSANNQLRQLADKVKGLGSLARMIDLDGLTGEEAASIADDLGEGLSALATLKNQLRKVSQ